MPDTLELIKTYYERFNQNDLEGFLALLSENIIHDISQGKREEGRDAFKAFMERMNRCYDERVYELVVMVNQDGTRAAAEMMLDGRYLSTDGNLPTATGQSYTIVVGAFFEVKEGKISRISNHYNMQDWLRQVS
jgi:steroid delta-isomerase-like uncharacterized protein